MVETLVIVITTLLITLSGLTIHLLIIFRVTEAGLLILNPKYLIARIVITLTPTPPSTNTLHNIDPLYYTSMIESHSRLIVMTFKGVDTFGTLNVNNRFLNSFRNNSTITLNCQMVMSTFCDSTSITTK
jgi:hypothetical protein